MYEGDSVVSQILACLSRKVLKLVGQRIPADLIQEHVLMLRPLKIHPDGGSWTVHGPLTQKGCSTCLGQVRWCTIKRRPFNRAYMLGFRSPNPFIIADLFLCKVRLSCQYAQGFCPMIDDAEHWRFRMILFSRLPGWVGFSIVQNKDRAGVRSWYPRPILTSCTLSIENSTITPHLQMRAEQHRCLHIGVAL